MVCYKARHSYRAAEMESVRRGREGKGGERTSLKLEPVEPQGQTEEELLTIITENNQIMSVITVIDLL